MKLLIGRSTGFSAKPWDMVGDDGVARAGIARNLIVSEDDGSTKLRIPDEFYNGLGKDERAYLEAAGREAFGSEVVASFTTDQRGRNNVDGLRLVAPDGTVLINRLALPSVFSAASA